MKKLIKGVNDLATLRPDLIDEWDYDNNPGYDPYNMYLHSGLMINWVCKNGHRWSALISARTKTNGTNCPYCAGQRVIPGQNDLQTLYPDLAIEFNTEKNGFAPNQICANYGKQVWWKCKYGHEWRVSPNSRIFQKTGCPECSSELKTSFPEQAIFYYLNKYGFSARNRFVIQGYELDIYIEDVRVAIEYDGKYYHNNHNSKQRELNKDQFCEENNIKLYRVKETLENDTTDTDRVFYHNVRVQTSLDRIITKLIHEIDETISDINIDCNRDRAVIWSQYLTQEKENSLKAKYPEIAAEWDYENNKGLLPDKVTCGSKKKVSWICS